MGGIEGEINGFLMPFCTVTNFTDSLGIYGVTNWEAGDSLNLLKQGCVIKKKNKINSA